MVGNVWEWTGTQYRESKYNPDDGRDELGAGDDIPRVLRGGSWNVNRGNARCCCRINFNYPDSGYDGDRFRVVVSPIL
jgi:formylglycine-generating enzyme required for sulfatase activity